MKKRQKSQNSFLQVFSNTRFKCLYHLKCRYTRVTTCAAIIQYLCYKNSRSAHQRISTWRPRLLPPSLCCASSSLPPCPLDYRVTVTAAPPERAEQAKTRRPHCSRAKGARGARRQRRGSKRSGCLRCCCANWARGAYRPRHLCWRHAEGAKGAHWSRRPRCCRAAGILPFPFPSPSPTSPRPAPPPLQRHDFSRDAANEYY